MNLRKERKELLPYKILLSILSNRYKECNFKGHLKPDEAGKLCHYCYRDLKNGKTDLIRGLAKLVDELGLV